MKIGLLSDTHSVLHPKVFEHFKNCDEIWHAGDIGTVEVIDKLAAFKPLKAVYGNIDNHKIRAICPKDLRFECEGVKVWITHIGGYPYRYTKNIREELDKNSPCTYVRVYFVGCARSRIISLTNPPMT